METTKTYSEKLKDPRWQKRRLFVLQRDNWKCQLCHDSTTTLHIHHLKYTTTNPHDEPDENLTTYCEDCHSVVEQLKNTVVIVGACKILYDGNIKTLTVWDEQKNIFFFKTENGVFRLKFGFNHMDFKVVLEYYNG